MSKPTKIQVDCSTGESVLVELTDEEIAQLEIDAQANAKVLAEEKAKQQAYLDTKASALAKLTALGLSEDEAKAIAG